MDLLAQDLARFTTQFEPRKAKYLYRCHEVPQGLLVSADERAAMLADFRRNWQNLSIALAAAVVIVVIAATIVLPLLGLGSEVKLALVAMVALIVFVAGRRWLWSAPYQALLRRRKSGG